MWSLNKAMDKIHHFTQFICFMFPQEYDNEFEELQKRITDWDIRLATVICQNFDECCNPERAFKVCHDSFLTDTVILRSSSHCLWCQLTNRFLQAAQSWLGCMRIPLMFTMLGDVQCLTRTIRTAARASQALPFAPWMS